MKADTFRIGLLPLFALWAAGCPSTKNEPKEASMAQPTPQVSESPRTVPTPSPAAPTSATSALEAVDDLLLRVNTVEGYTRVSLPDDSWGAWLRRLPLAAAGSPVRSFSGTVILPGDHENLAAVATLDIGKADLQQCADAVMRLHAEWDWANGVREITFQAASGMALPLARWEKGERIVPKGSSIMWVPAAAPSKDDHRSFRKYLDAVFAWANTVSLERQAKKVELDDLQPGDFFILPGNPGHTVLVLDLAVDGSGQRMVLLGQSYMPAQNFHVLRPRRDTAWFSLDPRAPGVQTPFWPKPFPWSSIRRL